MGKLKQPIDFDNAMYFKKKVNVCMGSEVIAYGIEIQDHCEQFIYTGKEYFFKSTCEFVI